MNKIRSLIIGAALLAATNLQAIPISIDLGPRGSVIERYLDFSGFEGTQMAGQSFSLDFSFPDSEFLRIYTTLGGAGSFSAFLFLYANAGNPFENTFPFRGSGYVTDANDQQYSYPAIHNTGNNGIFFLGLHPFISTAIQNIELGPLDIYGIHYDLTLPDLEGIEIVSSQLGIFGPGGFDFEIPNIAVGPGIPDHQSVPDTGSTLLLLTLALIPILLLHYDRRIRTT
jgi:hypothetical protein